MEEGRHVYGGYFSLERDKRGRRQGVKGGVTAPFTSAIVKKEPLGEIKVGSKTSPGIKVTGKVSGVDLNSWWSYSQKSIIYID